MPSQCAKLAGARSSRDPAFPSPRLDAVEIRIEKTFRFAAYYRTMAFVNAVASIAHREDHHPDLVVHYDRCVVAWSTHSAGGLTLNDGICAAKTDDAAAA